MSAAIASSIPPVTPSPIAESTMARWASRRRIRGQLYAVEAGVASEAECATLLHTLVACRGALNSLVVEMIEDHMRYHVVDPRRRATAEQRNATDEVIRLLRSCL